MDLSERLLWLLVGAAIGFIFGYIVRSLREIKEELHDVDEIVKKQSERGWAAPSFIRQVALLLVVVITVYAAFASQKASNDVVHTQDRIENVAICTQVTLDNTIKALNERTTYTVAQAQANVDLQKAQSAFIAVLVTVPTPSDAVKANALNEYFTKLNEFVMLSTQTVNKIEQNPYPTTEELSTCLAGVN